MKIKLTLTKTIIQDVDLKNYPPEYRSEEGVLKYEQDNIEIFVENENLIFEDYSPEITFEIISE